MYIPDAITIRIAPKLCKRGQFRSLLSPIPSTRGEQHEGGTTRGGNNERSSLRFEGDRLDVGNGFKRFATGLYEQIVGCMTGELLAVDDVDDQRFHLGIEIRV